MTQDKQHNRPNVPPLRFPEFSGEWEKHLTTDFFEFKNGLNPDVKRFGSGTKFISVMDILNNRYITYDKIISSVEAKDDDLRDFGVNYGDILFQRSSETLEDVGRANVYLDEKTALFGGFVIRGKKIGDYNPLFFRHLLSSPSVRKRIIVKGAGAQHFNIGQDGLSQVFLFVPSAKEQDRIAQLLNAIDKRIEVQSGLIEDLQKLKAALVERLFCNKLGWKRYKYRDLLSPISERNSGNQFSNVLSASQELGMVSRTDLDIDIKFDRSAVTTYKIVRDGDYVLHLRSFQGGLAFSSMTGICSPAYTILRPVKELEYGFFQEYFMSKSFINSLRLVTYGIRDGRSINVDEFLDMPVEIPDSATQCRIISILSIMNRRLRLAIKQNENFIKQKQYLLQQMFI